MTENAPRFRLRAFVSLGLLFSGLGLPLSGIANHLVQFEPLTPTRHAWMAAHNSLGLLFLLFALGHLILNRRALHQHLRGWALHIPTISREALAAGLLVTAVLLFWVGHAFHVPH